MADLILRLRVDPATGKRELVIDYTSDADALPIEHEDAHRQLANQLVSGGLAGASVEVTRAAAPPVAAAPASDGDPSAAPVAQPTHPR